MYIVTLSKKAWIGDIEVITSQENVLKDTASGVINLLKDYKITEAEIELFRQSRSNFETYSSDKSVDITILDVSILVNNPLPIDKFKDQFYGCFFGSIVGDALGMPYEFKQAKDIKYKPEMIAGGPFNLPEGCWTDDTSMMLCLSNSLISNKGYNNVKDQLCEYLAWYRDGKNSATNTCFDIGNQTRSALETFEKLGKIEAEFSKYSAGNGSLMRLAPIPLVFPPNFSIENISIISGRATHNNIMCDTTVSTMARLVSDLLVYDKSLKSNVFDKCNDPNGYVLGSAYLSVQAVLDTDSFASALESIILKGGDTDTNACITGMIAGAKYGYSSIPKQWLNSLMHFDKLLLTCDKLYSLRMEKMNNAN